MNRRMKWVLVVVAGALIVPVSAYASDRFADVPSSNVFHDDIAWMAQSGVTAGCNPPSNDRYCPSDVVTRQQMAAFMRRLATNRVVDADTVRGLAPADLKGNQGPKGAKGDPGTANVRYSEWFERAALTDETMDETPNRGFGVSVPGLTQEVVDTSSIQVFMRFAGRVWQLPYRSRAGGTDNVIDFYATPGQIRIHRMVDGCATDACLIDIADVVSFRYVVIPGGTAVGAPVGASAPPSDFVDVPADESVTSVD